MTEKPDNNAQTTAVPSDSAPVRAIVETEVFDNARREQAQIPAGFPWALVIQILMAILAYLIQHAVLPHDTRRLRELKSRLEPYQPVFQQKEEDPDD